MRAALFLLALIPALPARAHVALRFPTSRYGEEMKVRPCGRAGGTRTTNVCTFAPGETITVVFDEIIDHPGYFRIAFDPAGDDDLGPPTWTGSAWVNPSGVQLLADDIPDAPTPNTHGVVAVQLPAIECDTCTLQLIQVMTDKPPYDGVDDFYYQCADLVLRVGGSGSGPACTSASPPPPPPPLGGTAAGCDSGCGSAGAAGTAALIGLAPFLRRRRPPR